MQPVLIDSVHRITTDPLEQLVKKRSLCILYEDYVRQAKCIRPRVRQPMTSGVLIGMQGSCREDQLTTASDSAEYALARNLRHWYCYLSLGTFQHESSWWSCVGAADGKDRRAQSRRRTGETVSAEIPG